LNFEHFQEAAAIYHTAQEIARKIAFIEFVVATARPFIPPLQGGLVSRF
jgi:hypothetical protein